jgi:hypothetical protein
MINNILIQYLKSIKIMLMYLMNKDQNSKIKNRGLRVELSGGAHA